ncbi:MATE family efflux transporter [Streptococcus thermophilus]|uniref:MATE family efflux transporter n=1 Tax=Streptococcus thermophilus TaxID=1308 RepID=UPI002FE49BFA
MTTFTSQNFGAQQFKRIVEGSKQSCLVSIIWSIIACVLLYMISPFLVGLISGSDNAMIINNADRYLRISSLFILFWEYSSSLEIVSRG